MANCLVFGGSGFIGKRLVLDLLSEGHDVTVFARAGTVEVGTRHPKLHHFTGDFFNSFDVENAVEGQDYVFHLVSLTNPAVSENDPFIDVDTNVRTSIQLFEACVKHKVKKVLFTSSGGSIYGESPNHILREEDPAYPISPYAIGKQTIEGYLRYFQHKYALDYCAYRISNVYGEGQNTMNNKHGVISVFLHNISVGEQLNIYGDGSMTRDYIYVGDLSRFMAKNFQKSSQHRLYNVGSGTGVSVTEIVKVIEKITGKQAKLAYSPAPSSYVQSVVLDCARAIDEFGDFATTPLETGITHMLNELDRSDLRDSK